MDSVGTLTSKGLVPSKPHFLLLAGCQIHHVAECLSLSYGLQKPLIFNSTGFRYADEGLQAIYRPLSTCQTPDVLTERFNSTNELRLIQPRPKYLPGAVPADIVQVNHGNPLAWWMGQLKRFAMRLLPQIELAVEQIIGNGTLVGVQIRRSDKVSESQVFPVAAYMRHVDEYFDELEARGNVQRRRIFVASDEEVVVREIRANYPQYEVLANDGAMRDNGNYSNRYTRDALLGIVADIEILSRCDYLVGTFSSNVGRLAYELMQTRRVDAAESAVSLERHYYTVYQNLGQARAIMSHRTAREGEITFERDDRLIVYFHHSANGTFLGRNNRTDAFGLIPAYKMELLPEAVEFPLYERLGGE